MNHFQKSNKKIERLRGVFFQMGLIVACGLTFFAFEWKTSYIIPELPVCSGGDIFLIDDLPPITIQDRIKPPEVKIKKLTPNLDKIEIVPDDTFQEEAAEKLVEKVISSYNPDVWMITEKIVEALPPPPTPFPDVVPEFIGGLEGLFDYLHQETDYPLLAIENDIEGTVHLRFVVGKNGKIRDIEVLRGVNELLDQEAIRVVENMPDWIPGKKEGKKVSAIYNLPIHFKLK